MHQGSLAHVTPMHSKSPSLNITLTGVRAKPFSGQGSLSSRLYTSYADSTCRLTPFLDEIWQSFDVASFQLSSRYREVPQFIAPQIILADTKHASTRPKTMVPVSKVSQKLERVPPTTFKTQGITQKFENFVFAGELSLERLSLCRSGLTKDVEIFN